MAARKTQSAGNAASRASPAVPGSASLGMVLQRERLHALIDARLPGAVWLHGPTGAGKTVLLRSYVQHLQVASIWLSVDERHRDPAALFTAFSTIAEPHCAGRLPAFSPEHRDDPAAFGHDYFGRLDQVLAGDVAIVVDDLHHLVGTTAPLLAAAIDRFAGRRRLCFASQLMPDASFAPQLAGSRLWIVGHKALAFDVDEARGLALQIGSGATTFDKLVDATDGWAAGLMLAMQFGASGGTDGGSDDPLGTVRTPLAMLIAGQVLGGVPADDVARLRLLAELPQVPIELADVAPAWASACARLQGLADRGLFVERLVGDRLPTIGPLIGPPGATRVPKGCWRMHDLVRTALRQVEGAGDLHASLGNGLVDALNELGHLDLAWQMAAHLGAHALTQLVERHGSAALRDSRLLPMLHSAAPLADRDAPTIALWYARGLIGHDHAVALRSCEEAFRGYEAGADRAGCALTVALALFVIFATIEEVGEIAKWAERVADIERMDGDLRSDDEEVAIRCAGEVVHDLLVGGRAVQSSTQGAMQDGLMKHVAAQHLSSNETVLAGSLLVAAMCRTIRFAEAEMAILKVEGLSSFSRSAPHIRANWNIENGHHFTRIGEARRARTRFDEALVLADDNALTQPRIGALIGLARLELGLGDADRAAAHIDLLESIGTERLGLQRGWVVHLRSRVQALRGHVTAALSGIDQSERLILDAGFPRSTTVILDQDRIQLFYAQGDLDRSLSIVRRIIDVEAPGDAQRIDIVGGLLEAHAHWHRDRVRAQALLGDRLKTARLLNQVSFVSLLPSVAAEIVSFGLQSGIEVEFLKDVVRLRNLCAPADAPADWPWPLRIEVLSAFRICRNGQPLTFHGKTQQKPLDLLKYLSCSRDLVADTGTLVAALWPDADEVAGKKSLEVTVSRLRKLLDDDALVQVREGKVSLDRQRTSSDAREFMTIAALAEAIAINRADPDRVVEVGERLLSLFHALPLEHEEATAWREATRERYRSAFLRAARALIAYWQQKGDAARASRLIEAALSREPLSETLYRLLMRIHIDAGQPSEAMRVYRQCRQMLSVLIGMQPSAETEQLKNSIPL